MVALINSNSETIGQRKHVALTLAMVAMVQGAAVTGCLKGDCVTGLGMKKFEDKSVFEGEFENDQPVKLGKFTRFATQYFGSIKDGLEDGFGIEIHDEYSFAGPFSKGKKHGWGVRIQNEKETLCYYSFGKYYRAAASSTEQKYARNNAATAASNEQDVQLLLEALHAITIKQF